MLKNISESELDNSPISHNDPNKIIDNLIQLKIVYWGPGESGKTTNFLRLKEKFSAERVSEGYSIETNDGRTLWQDSLFLSFEATINQKEFTIIIHIVTCTGQERFLSTREYVLNGADGVIFVADSNLKMMEQNKRSFRELLSFSKLKGIPYVIQLNKQDLERKITVERFKQQLHLPMEDQYSDGTLVVYPCIALNGINVIEVFRDLLGQVLFNIFKFS